MSFLDRLLGRPTLENLIRDVTARLGKQGCTEIQALPERMEIRFNRNGHSPLLYLGNLLQEWRTASRRGRPLVLQKFLATLLSDDDAVPADYEAARPRLLPVVRSADNMGVICQSLIKTGDPARSRPAQRTLAADVVVGLVVDQPNSMAYVLERTLNDWGATWDQALQDAVDNLRGLPEHGGWTEAAPGVWSGQWADSYESSRLLIPDLVHRLGINDPVAMVPFRNSLLVASAGNTGAIERMVQMAYDALDDQGRWVSFELLRLEGSTWTQFKPSDPAAERQSAMLIRSRSESYEGQRQVLEGQFEEQNIDLHVATCSLMQKNGAPLTSYAVWSENVDTLLPQAESIVLYQQDGDKSWHARLPWADVQEQFGHLMEPTDHVPVRYRVTQFPDRAALRALAASVNLDAD